jgi:hypothetical protein
VDWAQRLHIGTGVENAGGGFGPRAGWRSLTSAERSLLVPDPTLPLARDVLPECLCLFQLPRHLLAAWWRLVEEALQRVPTRLEGFETFAGEVARFLAFKELPVPQSTAFDLLTSQPGLGSIPWNGARVWGGINLGEEPSGVIFLPLLAKDLQARVEHDPGRPAVSRSDGDLGELFLARAPDDPLVRLQIEPGEGFRFPVGGLLGYGCTQDQQEPGVWLLMRQENESSA